MKRLFVFAVIFTLAFGALAAMPTRAATTITVWTTGSEDDALIFKAAADLWAAKTGNEVKVEAVSWNDTYAKNLAAVTSGQGPDIFTGGLSYGIDFGSKGGLVNLGEKYADDIKSMQETTYQGVWPSIMNTAGEVFAVPYDLTVYLMYFRPDLLKEAGVEAAPKTWEELTAAIKMVQAKTEGSAFAMQWGNAQWLYFANYLYQAGGDFYTPDCSEVTINSEEGVAALDFMASLYKDYGSPTDGWPDLENGLVTGQYPFGATGNWLVGSLDVGKPEIAGKWEIAPLPAGPSGKSTVFLGGRVMGIMSFSQNVDLAWDLIKFLYTEEGASAMLAKATEKSAIFFPPVTAYYDLLKVDAAKLDAIKTQLNDAKGPPNCPGWEEGANEVQRLLDTVLLKDADAQEALDAAAAELERLLNE